MAVLGEWRGGTTSLLPTTSWAAPNGLFSGTATRNDSAAYSFNSSTSTLTLPSSDLADGYLVIGAYEFEDASSGRHNPVARFEQTGGTGTFVSGVSSGYNRDASEDRAYVRTWAFIDNPSASATIQFQWRRDSDSPTGGTVRSQLQVIPLYYSNHGIYSSTDATVAGGTTPNTITSWTTEDQSNTAAIEISSGVVTIKGDNKRYLVLGSQWWHTSFGSRTQRWHGLAVGGSLENDVRAYSYVRDSSNSMAGDMYTTIVETSTADLALSNVVFTGEALGTWPQTGADSDVGTGSTEAQHSFVVLELNDSAEVFRSVSNTQQDIDTAGARVDIQVADVVDFNDSSSFTKTSNTAINLETDADVLLGANVSGGYASSSGARYTGYAEFTVNGTGETYSVAGDYSRGDQGTTDTWGWSANLMSFVAGSTGDDLGVDAGKISGGEGGTVDTIAGWTGFWGINLDTLTATTTEHTATDGSSSFSAVTVSGAAERSITSSSASIVASSAEVSGSADKVAPNRAIVTWVEFSYWPEASLEHEATGSITTAATTASGSGSRAITGSGAITITPVEIGGEAENEVVGEGSVDLPTAQVVGVAERQLTSSGDMTTGPPTVTGSAERVITGSGAITTGAVQVVGTLGKAASGAISVSPVTVSGESEVSRVASGAVSIAPVATNGLAEKEVVSESANITLGAVTIDSLVSTAGEVTSSGNITTGAITASGSAEREVTSTASIVTPVTEVSGSASKGQVISDSITTSPVTVSGSGNKGVVGSGVITISPVTASGSAEREIKTTSADVTISPVTTSGSATKGAANRAIVTWVEFQIVAEPAIIADGDVAITPVTVSGSAGKEVFGIGAITTPATEVSSVAERAATASGDITIPAVTASGNGKKSVFATGDVSITPVEVDGAGDIFFNTIVPVDAGAITVVGYAPQSRFGAGEEVPVGGVTFSGFAPVGGPLPTPAPAEIILQGFAPEMSIGLDISINLSIISLTGIAPVSGAFNVGSLNPEAQVLVDFEHRVIHVEAPESNVVQLVLQENRVATVEAQDTSITQLIDYENRVVYATKRN